MTLTNDRTGRLSKYLISAVIIIASSFYYRNLNPEIKSDEDLLFYPAYAYENDKGTITCRIHGHVFEKEEDTILRNTVIKAIVNAAGENEYNEQFTPFLSERIKPFLYDNESNKEITIQINRGLYKLDKSGANGHFYGAPELNPPGKKTRSIIKYNIILSEVDRRTFSGSSIYIPPRGISVISDIDDTIKDSNVTDKKELLKNTFLREFKAVKGMPEFYRKLKSQGAAFHYVSGSPWQLYQSISEFMNKEKFPAGSMHLKYIRVKDSSIIDFIAADQLSFKVKNIESILKDFPQRKFILVGDSGEFDPEVYTEITSRHKEKVLAVLIRDVNKPGDAPERYEKLRAMAPGIKFRLFRTPDELDIRELKNR